jgi:hypothetical protein
MFSPEAVRNQNPPIVTRIQAHAAQFVDQDAGGKGSDLRAALVSDRPQRDFQPSIIFSNMARFVFSFVFPQERIFNNFPASFLGSFSAIHVAFC